jgi:hypothetical protein
MPTYLKMLLLAGAVSMGCAKTEPAPTKTQAPLSAGQIARDAAPGSLRQKISRAGVLNELHQFGIFYRMYNLERNRSPGSLDDMKPYIERDASRLYQAIKDGFYEVVWNVPELSGNALLAYQKTPDEDGNHQALMGDGSVKKMTENEVQEALKKK